MGLCKICRTIIPPRFMYAEEEGDGQICAFCKTGKRELTIEHVDGTIKKVTKNEIANKYKEFTDDIVNKPNTMRKIVRGEI